MKTQKFYVSYNRAVHVFFMSIAGLFGPFFVASGIDPQYKKNLIYGIALTTFFVYNLIKTYVQRDALVKSDKIAFLWVPLFFMPLGVFFAILEAAK